MPMKSKGHEDKALLEDTTCHPKALTKVSCTEVIEDKKEYAKTKGEEFRIR